MNDTAHIADITKTSKEVLRIQRDDRYIYARSFFTDPSGTMRPGKEGIKIPKTALKEFATVLAKEVAKLSSARCDEFGIDVPYHEEIVCI